MDEKDIIVDLDDNIQDIIIDEDDNTEFEVNRNNSIFRETTDYNKLGNKPKINHIELMNDKSLNELGIQEKGDYADSRITNLEIEYIFRDW